MSSLDLSDLAVSEAFLKEVSSLLNFLKLS